MFETQTQPQASSLYIYGGINTLIKGNTFTGHRNEAGPYMKAFGYDVYRYMPRNYFEYSQASIIRIEYPPGVYPDIMARLAENTDNRSVRTSMIKNIFTENLNMQVLTF
jgi:hypothetical protein